MRKHSQKDLGLQIQFFHEMIQSVPGLELVLPQYTYQDTFTIYGEKRTAKLKTLGGAHSICDAFLYIPEEKIAFMADLLFVESHPAFFDDSDLAGWIRILKEVAEMKVDVAVPGHGRVGAKQDTAKVITYIQDLKEIAKEGRDPKEVEMPKKYKKWAAPEVFRRNLEILQKTTTRP